MKVFKQFKDKDTIEEITFDEAIKELNDYWANVRDVLLGTTKDHPLWTSTAFYWLEL